MHLPQYARNSMFVPNRNGHDRIRPYSAGVQAFFTKRDPFRRQERAEKKSVVGMINSLNEAEAMFFDKRIAEKTKP